MIIKMITFNKIIDIFDLDCYFHQYSNQYIFIKDYINKDMLHIFTNINIILHKKYKYSPHPYAKDNPTFNVNCELNSALAIHHELIIK